MELKDLTPNPKNPRNISEEKLVQLEKSLKTLGPLDGFVFNIRFHRLIGAHQRKKVMPPTAEIHITERYSTPTETGTVAVGYVEAFGERHNYREVDVDADTEKAMNLAANKGGGEWDRSLLGEWMKELKGGGFDLGLTMFDEPEIDQLTAKDTENKSPSDEWKGMPEYQNKDLTSVRHLIVHFKAHEDVEVFAKLIGQGLTEKTRSIWFPQVEIDRLMDKRYVSES